MLLYRIANKKFAKDISGIGAKLNGSRWNEKGFAMLYTATNVSLASLEVLANIQYMSIQVDYELVVLETPKKIMIEVLDDKLELGWTKNIELTQLKGIEWIKSMHSLVLEVPSAIVPIDKNILINPLHPDFQKIKILDVFGYNFDNRLVK